MNINWPEFTPIAALIGGVVIGIAASFLAIFNGRIAGISGILSQLLSYKNAPEGHFTWRILFILGLLLSGWAYQIFHPLPAIELTSSMPKMIIAGLLVGIGTKLGSGCTSGHGVCGLGRLSSRSLVATLSFMGAGFFACYIFLHLFN